MGLPPPPGAHSPIDDDPMGLPPPLSPAYAAAARAASGSRPPRPGSAHEPPPPPKRHISQWPPRPASDGEVGGEDDEAAATLAAIEEGVRGEEVGRLMSALACEGQLAESPYASSLSTKALRPALADRFSRECLRLLGLPPKPPLYTCTEVAELALPKMVKLAGVMKGKYAETWKARGVLPLDLDLPPEYTFHSTFVCPISKEPATPDNPPMLLPCGHVLRRSLPRLSRPVWLGALHAQDGGRSSRTGARAQLGERPRQGGGHSALQVPVLPEGGDADAVSRAHLMRRAPSCVAIGACTALNDRVKRLMGDGGR